MTQLRVKEGLLMFEFCCFFDQREIDADSGLVLVLAQSRVNLHTYILHLHTSLCMQQHYDVSVSLASKHD